MPRHRFSLGTLVVLVVLVVWLVTRSHGLPGQIIQQDQPGLYSIKYFVDGDTIAVNMNGQAEKVRFIGVDTPETHKPNTPVQCFGPQAAAYTKSTIGKQRVRLVSDSLSTDRDRYNRLLRYVYLPDGTNVNEKLVQQGYGFYYPFFPFSKQAQFSADEQSATIQHKGLWAACHPTPTDQGGYKMDQPA
ncbi:MAG TPA: thermonuclease family protein [Candidatus Saccharimonadales bacterium]|jgi:micrococcal nuclease|nr:thermonuclease family protein [Candidatus Saccharimonadales bacterium]